MAVLWDSQLTKSQRRGQDFETIINEVALLRNKWLGVMKGVESKNFMLGHVVRLRTAGMEDVVV